MDEHDFFRIVALVAVLFLVLPAAVPSMRASTKRIRMIGVWVLAFGMLIALFLLVEHLLNGGT